MIVFLHQHNASITQQIAYSKNSKKQASGLTNRYSTQRLKKNRAYTESTAWESWNLFTSGIASVCIAAQIKSEQNKINYNIEQKQT